MDVILAFYLTGYLNQGFPTALINQLHKHLTILTKHLLCEQPAKHQVLREVILNMKVPCPWAKS